MVFEEVVGEVESTASHHIANQQDLHNEQKQLEHRLYSPIQIKGTNDDILNVQQLFDPEEEYKQNKFEVLLLNLKDLYKLVEEDDCNRYYIKDKPVLYVVLSYQNRTTLQPAILIKTGIQIDEDRHQEDPYNRKVDSLEKDLIGIPVVIWIRELLLKVMAMGISRK